MTAIASKWRQWNCRKSKNSQNLLKNVVKTCLDPSRCQTRKSFGLRMWDIFVWQGECRCTHTHTKSRKWIVCGTLGVDIGHAQMLLSYIFRMRRGRQRKERKRRKGRTSVGLSPVYTWKRLAETTTNPLKVFCKQVAERLAPINRILSIIGSQKIIRINKCKPNFRHNNSQFWIPKFGTSFFVFLIQFGKFIIFGRGMNTISTTGFKRTKVCRLRYVQFLVVVKHFDQWTDQQGQPLRMVEFEQTLKDERRSAGKSFRH